MKALDTKTIIIERLLKMGWKADGHTATDTFKMITHESYPLAGKIVTMGGRERFRKGKWQVTVGKITTFFYIWDVEKKRIVENRHISSKDVDTIEAFASTISEERTPVKKAFNPNKYEFEKWLWIKAMQDPRYIENLESFSKGSISHQDLRDKAKEIFQELKKDEDNLYEEFLMKPQGK